VQCRRGGPAGAEVFFDPERYGDKELKVSAGTGGVVPSRDDRHT
jgi:hypothetical protein